MVLVAICSVEGQWIFGAPEWIKEAWIPWEQLLEKLSRHMWLTLCSSAMMNFLKCAQDFPSLHCGLLSGEVG